MEGITPVITNNTYHANVKVIEDSIQQHKLKIKDLRKTLRSWERLKSASDVFQKKIEEMIPTIDPQMDIEDELQRV